MTTANLNLTEFVDGQDNPDVPINEGLNVFDAKVCEVLVIDFASDADLNITATGTKPQQWQYAGFEMTDTGTSLTTGRNVVLPNTEKAFYSFHNNTAQSLTLKTSGGTGITVATTKRALLYSDGTNVVRYTPDT
jgi:hypothetical protein